MIARLLCDLYYHHQPKPAVSVFRFKDRMKVNRIWRPFKLALEKEGQRVSSTRLDCNSTKISRAKAFVFAIELLNKAIDFVKIEFHLLW